MRAYCSMARRAAPASGCAAPRVTGAEQRSAAAPETQLACMPARRCDRARSCRTALRNAGEIDGSADARLRTSSNAAAAYKVQIPASPSFEYITGGLAFEKK